MRALWVGVCLDSTGWARATNDYLLALDAAGVDVVARPLKLNGRKEPVHPRVAELIRKPSGGKFDAVVQHVLPHMMSRDARLGKNIGLFASETSNFRAAGWADHLNLMDEVWVINRQQADACLDSGVKRPIRVVPHACCPKDYEGPFPVFPGLGPEFKFYTVGEAVHRKNLAGLLKAYFGEFHADEPVNLVVKADVPGMGPREGAKRLHEYVKEIARGMKVRRHPRVHLITARLPEEAMLSLHASCDVFVQASYGEAWSLPAFAAMAMGKTPVVPWSTGFKDYMGNQVGYTVNCRLEPCFGAVDTLEDIHGAAEEWWAPDLLQLKRRMREAYTDLNRGDKAANGRRWAKEYSHEAVGLLMRSLLEPADEKPDPGSELEGASRPVGP